MAEDDQDRTQEKQAELEAEINSELERVGKDPDEVDDGSDNLGTQSAPSGTPHEDGQPSAERDDDEVDETAGEEALPPDDEDEAADTQEDEA